MQTRGDFALATEDLTRALDEARARYDTVNVDGVTATGEETAPARA